MKLTLVILAVLVAVAFATPVKRSADNAVSELLEELEKRGRGGKVKDAAAEKADGKKGGRGGPRSGSKSESEDEDEKGDRKDGKEKMFEEIAEKCGIKVQKDQMPAPVTKEQFKGLLQEVKGFLDTISKNFEENEGIFAKAKDAENEQEVADTHKAAMDNFAKLGGDEVAKKAFCLKVKATMLKYAVHYSGLSQAEDQFKGVPQCLNTCTILVVSYISKSAVPFDKVPEAIQGDHACLKAGVEKVKELAQNGIDNMDIISAMPTIEFAIELLFTRGHQLHICSMHLHEMHKQQAEASKGTAEAETAKPAAREMRELLKALDVYLKQH